ncbi:MAG TPA: hypothetical protein VJV78_27185 [Polyangiales bacterium]|nr:hypothetical protein [Polyangiales bacterium]
MLLFPSDVQLVLAMLMLLIAATQARAQEGAGRRFDPCSDGASSFWASLTWVGSPLMAERDGWIWRATLSHPVLRPNSNSLPGRADAVLIRVTAADGSEVTGRLEAGPVQGTESFLIWRPAAPLPPNAAFGISLEVDNLRVSGCSSAPKFSQSLSVTTANDLTPAPESPPLREVAAGYVWVTHGSECCETLDRSRCNDAPHCYACWTADHELTIAPLFDAPAPSEDVVQYDLFFGTSTSSPIAASRTGGVPDTFIWPARHPELRLSPDASEVCLTAVARQLRTGALATRTRCSALPDADEDAGAASDALPSELPSTLSRTQPTDSSLTIGPPHCVAPSPVLFGDRELTVAMSYHLERLGCPNGACTMTQQPTPTEAEPGGCHSVRARGAAAWSRSVWYAFALLWSARLARRRARGESRARMSATMYMNLGLILYAIYRTVAR